MKAPINLNKVRKAKAKAAKSANSAQNRAKFGRTKQEKAAETLRSDKEKAVLDAHKLRE